MASHPRSVLLFLLALVLQCQAQTLDFSGSEALAKPYSQAWNKWALDGRPQAQQVADIAQDFRGLAATDFIAACVAFFRAKQVPPQYIHPLNQELGEELRRGLALYSRYIVDDYLHKREGKPKPTYPEQLPRPGQPWPGLVAEKQPLRQASQPRPRQPSQQVNRKPKFVNREAVYSRTGKTNRAPLAYIGGYAAKTDTYLLLGTYRPMNDGPYSGKPRDRYVDAAKVEADYVSSNPRTYMCPGCEGRRKRDVGRYVSLSRQSNKDRIVVNKNQPLRRVDCGDCLGRGWGTLYSIKTKIK